VHENIEDFDEIFEELYDKYKDRGKMSPEMRLVMAVGGSGFMCHVSNSFFRSKMPTADDIFKKNPELARQFAAAAAQQASPGFGNFMGMAMGVPQPQQQMPAGPQGMPQPQMPPRTTGPTGSFFGSSQQEMRQEPQVMASVEPPRTARREMRGPTGVDDILRTFEEVRQAEEQQNTMPNFPMPTQMQSPAMAAAVELQSIASEDVGSIGTTQTNSGRRRGRRQAPSGNVVSLNA
jgi:ribosomal protein S28E/S33